MEIHAHVPRLGKTWSHWLLEGLFIVLSVGLAFSVGQCREARENRELATRALRGLADELEFNQKTVAPYVDMHKTWAQALQKAADTSGWKTGVEAYAGTRPPFTSDRPAEFPLEVRRGAWDAALSTGALRFIDYDVVAALSHTYQVQTFYGDGINRVVAAVTATPAFEPATQSLVVRQLAVDMQSLIFAEETLMDTYKRSLPAVQKAADETR